MADRQAARASLAEDSVEDVQNTPFTYEPHVYEAERCINCNVNVYDNDMYGPFECVSRASVCYTTETIPAPSTKENDE
uniref:Uncharacterized protein n=2 Tax=unclassified bacterial viruses TaxID=12333 RepID=A0AAU7J8K4_9VIRU